MKRFKIGNTVVNLGDVEFQPNPNCPSFTIQCALTPNPTITWCQAQTLLTCQFFSNGCLGFISRDPCGVNFSTCAFTQFTVDINITDQIQAGNVDPEVLVAMKEQLSVQMKALEDAEVQLDKSARPQTLEDADEMQKQLEAALKEVKALKKDLK